jgi:Ca2+-binding RTX toxin-like protein
VINVRHPKSVAVALGLVAALGPAAAAHAAGAASYVKREQVRPEQAFVHVDALSGKTNDVKFVKDGASIVVTDGDAGARAKAGSNCRMTLVANPITQRSFVSCLADTVEAVNVTLGSGNDRSLNSANTRSNMKGDAGRDRLFGGTDYDGLWGGADNDYLDGGKGGDSLFGEGGNDQLVGGEGDDHFSGGDGDDIYNGGSGADDFVVSPGADLFIGGDDPGRLQSVDGVTYQFTAQPVRVTLDNQANDGVAGEGDNVRDDVERVNGGDVGDELIGSFGADVLAGLSGDDKLRGGPGIDELRGGYDQDDLRGGDANDFLDGDDGDDTLVGDQGDDTLDGGRGADVMRGGTETDTVVYSGRDVPVSVDFDGAADDGQAGEADNAGVDVENAIGGNAGDKLTGDERSNLLLGGAGDDELDGGAGGDTLNGGDGADRITSRDGVADDVVCGAGADTVIADAVDTVAADCETVELPQAPVTPDAGNGTPPAAATPCSSVTVAKARVKVKKGAASVRLTAKGGVTCGARVSLTAGGKTAKAITILDPGRSVTVRFKVPGAARKSLARKGSLKAKVSVKTVDAAGRVIVSGGSLRLAR